ncbi:MAG: hypothetical protein AB8G05_23810 [Oligoflexales bacterium]
MDKKKIALASLLLSGIAQAENRVNLINQSIIVDASNLRSVTIEEFDANFQTPQDYTTFEYDEEDEFYELFAEELADSNGCCSNTGCTCNNSCGNNSSC